MCNLSLHLALLYLKFVKHCTNRRESPSLPSTKSLISFCTKLQKTHCMHCIRRRIFGNLYLRLPECICIMLKAIQRRVQQCNAACMRTGPHCKLHLPPFKT